MAKKKKKPVSVWGIEFDALISDTKTYTTSIPTYPVEDGFPVSDTMVNEPIAISLTLYLTNTPVTWLYRHGTSTDRVNKVCEEIEQKWYSKKLAKIVTPDAIYKDMGITSISISNTSEPGYAKEITIEAQKVVKTNRKTDLVPTYSNKSGTTAASAGTATTSDTKNTDEDVTEKKKSILYGLAEGFNLF